MSCEFVASYFWNSLKINKKSSDLHGQIDLYYTNRKNFPFSKASKML